MATNREPTGGASFSTAVSGKGGKGLTGMLPQPEPETLNEELRRTQTMLEASLAYYFDLYEHAPVGYLSITGQGVILDANRTAARLLSVAQLELPTRSLVSFILPEDQEFYQQQCKRLSAMGKPQQGELRLVRKDAPPLWVRYDSRTTRDAVGVTHCMVVIVDINRRKDVEAKLHHTEEALRMANQRLKQMVICEQRPADGNVLPSLKNHAYSAETYRYMAETRLQERTAGSAEVSTEAAGTLPHELQLHQIELEMQNEELRWSQRELEASQSRYYYLYELAPVGFVTLSEQGHILEANLTAATLLGLGRGALIGQMLARFIVPEDRNIYYRHRMQLQATATRQVCEVRMMKRDGTQFRARLEATAGQAANGAPEYRALLSDITGLKPMEEV